MLHLSPSVGLPEEAIYAKCILLTASQINSHRSPLHFCVPALVAQLDVRPTGDQDPRRGRQNSFVEIDHEIFSTVILSLPLIQEGQLSVSGERMCTILVNHLED